ncbi:MAG: pyridoxamine 5'-phosphate oxidase family protein [Pyrinomonadaceae bacterium]
MSEFEKTTRNTVRRQPSRGAYDKETLFAILDEGFLCHIGFAVEGLPYVIPTLYGRIDEKIYIHGSSVSRMLGELKGGIDLCLTVTHTDGIVLARSAFHHSMNYRSAVVFGKGCLVEDRELKMEALAAISDRVAPGRWDDSRLPNDKELNVTSVIEIEIENASSKMRTGGPKDDLSDYESDYWAGVIPLKMVPGNAIPDEKLKEGIGLPAYLKMPPYISD